MLQANFSVAYDLAKLKRNFRKLMASFKVRWLVIAIYPTVSDNFQNLFAVEKK